MKLSVEVKNGILIFFGIGIYFLFMEMAGLADQHIFRLFNALIVLFGINKSIQYNFKHSNDGYLENFVSGIVTGVVGIVASLIGLITFIYIKGGESYLVNLSDTYWFVGNTNIIKYVAVLFFEGIASTIIGSFILMQYWKGVSLSNTVVTK
jgi:hypothetical protein